MTRQRPGLVLSPDDDAILAARAAVRYQLLAFSAVEEGAREGEVEPVHQLRVATRRLRATLRLFAPLLSRRFGDAAHRDLAWLAGAIGRTRDLDVLFAAVKTRARRLEPTLRAGLGPLGLAIQEKRSVAHSALVAALRTPRAHRLLRQLTAFVESPGARRRTPRLGDAAPDLIRPFVRAVRRAGRSLDADAEPAAFHRLRVRVKRLRYALETLRGLGDRPTRRLLTRLEDLQDTLGQSQDAAAQVVWLHAWAKTPGAPVETLLPTGALIELLARRGKKYCRRALRRWRKMDTGGLLDAALEDIEGGVRGERAAAAEVSSA
jgi:CHAD domain-containing protein